MYKHCFMICLTLAKLNACELMNGVTIPPEVDALFVKTALLYVEDVAARARIEELYAEYILLLSMSGRSDIRSLNRARDIQSLLSTLIYENEVTRR